MFPAHLSSATLPHSPSSIARVDPWEFCGLPRIILMLPGDKTARIGARSCLYGWVDEGIQQEAVWETALGFLGGPKYDLCAQQGHTDELCMGQIDVTVAEGPRCLEEELADWLLQLQLPSPVTHMPTLIRSVSSILSVLRMCQGWPPKEGRGQS